MAPKAEFAGAPGRVPGASARGYFLCRRYLRRQRSIMGLA